MKRDILIYGKTYKLWRKGKFIGIATYVEDENIGDAFIKETTLSDGTPNNDVYIPDEWELLVE